MAVASTLPGQGPVSLLADVETAAPNNPGSFYEPGLLSGVTWNSYLYFAADGDGRGAELWRTSGAVADATLVRDLVPDGGAEPQLVGVLGGWLLFVADDAVSGRELWRTDGTAAGTQILLDITPGNLGTFGSEAPFVRMNSLYYFLAAGRLWRTDGTPGNTFPVSATTVLADELFAGPSHLWMPVDTGSGGELWASDGTSSVYLASTLPALPSSLVPLAGIQVVFACDDGVTGQELWRSDGTQGGTQQLVDLQPGSGSSWPSEFAAVNGLAVFSATDGGGTRLWRSDGTVGGTFVLDPAVGPRFPQDVRTCGNRVWFNATKSSGTDVGGEVWSSDGTVAGTQFVYDVWPGSPTSGASGFAYDGVQWTYFHAHDGSTGYELWRSDGVTTQRCGDIVPGFGDGSPTVLGFVGGYCVYAGILDGSGELFASLGTGSHLVRDIRRGSNGDSDPQRIVPQVDGRFFFTAIRGPNAGPGAVGREPHFSSGASGSAQLLVDAAGGPTSGGGIHTRASSFGSYTWFNTVPGSVLWRTAGTVPSTNAIPGLQATFTDMVTFAGRVFLDGSTTATGEELFVVDDPLGPAVLVKDVLPGSGGNVTNLCVVGNRLFFTAQDPLGMNLWVTDGTTAGTQRVWQNTLGGNFFNLRAVGRRLFFDLGSSPGPLLVSDGTATGTTTVGIVGQDHHKVAVGDRLFFAGEPNGAGTGLELCVTDGTTISLVKDVRPGGASSQPYALCAFGDGVLFLADDGVHGFELWRSDGSTAGTQLVRDLLPGAASGCPRYDGGGNGYAGFVFAPGGAARALLAGSDGNGGMELWRTDGTAAGTVLHAELQPGPLGSFPGQPARAGTQLVFSATQTEPATPTGRELFAMATMAVAVPVGTSCASSLATAPIAAANGAPFLGNGAFALTVAAVPSSIVLLALGDPVEVLLAPCELRVANFATPLALLTNGNGDAVQPLPIPASLAFAGLRLSAQWAVLQGGPFLGFASLSNGVDLVLQAQ
ncbi:MAG: hypothetical protein IT456_04970 [Planctomycetes bacterium]|nr:hypothetical protein [Planctomycetota bacterium]